MTGRVLVLMLLLTHQRCAERSAVVMIFKGCACGRTQRPHAPLGEVCRFMRLCDPVDGEYKHIPFERRSLSRRTFCCAIIPRANTRGRQYAPAELTLDQGCRVPRGESPWDNLVACCKRCNHRKGSRTPEESVCISCAGARLVFPFTLKGRSCAIWAVPTKAGANICSTNQTKASDKGDPSVATREVRQS